MDVAGLAVLYVMAIIVPTDVKLFTSCIRQCNIYTHESNCCFYTPSEHPSVIGFVVHGDICLTLQFPVGDTVDTREGKGSSGEQGE